MVLPAIVSCWYPIYYLFDSYQRPQDGRQRYIWLKNEGSGAIGGHRETLYMTHRGR